MSGDGWIRGYIGIFDRSDFRTLGLSKDLGQTHHGNFNRERES